MKGWRGWPVADLRTAYNVEKVARGPLTPLRCVRGSDGPFPAERNQTH